MKIPQPALLDAPPPMAPKQKSPPKKPAQEFVNNAQKNWKLIEARLRADNVAPVKAYEAALAQMRGMHFDADLARSFNAAYSDVQLEQMRDKTASKVRRSE